MKLKYALTFLPLIFSTYGWSQQKNYTDQPYLETTAVVDTLVSPDRIFLNIIILENVTKGKTSVEELEIEMEKMLQRIGINTKEHITLNDLASNFKDYFLKPQDILKSKSYTLMVSDANTAGLVIMELEKIQISNVVLDRTEFSKIQNLKLELKSKAMDRARKQAEYMTIPLDQSIGSAIHISDQTVEFVDHALEGKTSGITIRGYSSKVTTAYGVESVDIEFEKIKVESRVSVKFQLVN